MAFRTRRLIPAILCKGFLAGVALLCLACGGGGNSNASTNPVAPSITVDPRDTTVVAGRSAVFTVTAIGSSPLNYQWKRGSTSIGTNSPTYTTPATTTADNGAKFSVTVTNAAGQVTSKEATLTVSNQGTAVRIAYLHHSTGGCVWQGGVPDFFEAYNADHGTHYQISEITYPSTSGGYSWANYPYDYWNLWVNHTGTDQDQGELNLDQLAADYDVIMFKHCFPVSSIGPNSDCDPPDIASNTQTIANYQLQYNALKTRMAEFPGKKFVLWTGAALRESETTPANAQRARDFFTWVKTTWDTPSDNIFIWDFFELETGGGNYLLPQNASIDSHPGTAFCITVAPLIGQRIVDVIEGRGDSGSLTGQ